MRYLLSFLFILGFVPLLLAYDVFIQSVETTPSRCGDDGSITVHLGGADAASLESSSLTAYTAGGKTSSYNTIPGLAAGTYELTVSGMLGGNLIVLNDIVVVSGIASYISLKTQILNVRNTMPSMSTGKITLSITEGKLPYTVELSLSGSVVATQIFTEAQSEYLLENLLAGDYSIKVSDGCTNSYLSTAVSIQNPVFQCYGIVLRMVSHDTTNISIFMFNSNPPDKSYEDYYNEHRMGTNVWWEYAYAYDTGGFTEWRDVPQDGWVTDVVDDEKYCDMWEKSYTVKVRVKGGDGTVVCEQKLLVARPLVSYRDFVSLYDDGCIKDTFIIYSVSGNYYHPPLNMMVINVNEKDTLFNDIFVDNSEIQISSTMFGDTLRAVFTDAKSCIFEDRRLLDTVMFNYWSIASYSSPCAMKNHVEVNFNHPSVIKESSSAASLPPVGTVVELIEAPDPQLCFKVEWDRTAREWAVRTPGRRTDDIITFTKTVRLNDTAEVMYDTDLPSGKYVFHIYDGCGYDTILTQSINFYRYEIIDSLKINEPQLTCAGVEYFPTGKVLRHRCVAGGYEAAEEIDTYFSVYPLDGGSANITGSVVNTGSVIINPQYNGEIQNFIIYHRYFSNSCEISTLPFTYKKPSVINFKNTVGYCCYGSDATIIAVPDSTKGIQPYNFTLYSELGNEIESNMTGVFNIITSEINFKIKMTDNCNETDAAYTEITRDISLLRIGVDRVIQGREIICFGERDSLVCMLNAGVYEWTRPDGTIEKDRVISVSCEDENNLQIGWYWLKITGLHCDVADSIYVDVKYPYNDTIVVPPICDSELPYSFDNRIFESGGFHTFYETSIYGCDSITNYELTVYPTYLRNDMDTICESDLPYTYANDTTFSVGTETGIYTFYRKTIHGCDSIVNLHLTVGNLPETVFHDTIFKYETYSKHNFDLPSQTEIGDFTHIQNLQTIYGCDSTVTLYLTVHDIVKARITSHDVEVCGDEKDFFIGYEIYDGRLDFYDIQFSSKTLQAGFYDFTDGNPNGETLRIMVPNEVRPDYYSLDITFGNNSGYFDKHSVDFKVLYPSSVVMQMWNDVLALLNSGNNGGYEFTAYQWYKNGLPLFGETQSYIYLGPNNTLDMNAEYSVELTRSGDGVTLFSCPVVPVFEQEISVYPTLVSSSQNITIKAKSRGIVSIWSMSGVKLSEQGLEEGSNTISSPTRSGMYMLQLIYDSGARNKQLIIVQ